MMAVLQAVLDDVLGATHAAGTAARPDDLRARRQAMAYVESPDRSWPFSFENICDAVGLDTESIRRRLRSSAAEILETEAERPQFCSVGL
jgi:hypothetical protein